MYILANRYDTVLYVGVTSDLLRRIEEHRSGQGSTFTTRYRVYKLVYAEEHATAYDAISREKQLKGWTRRRKLELIQGSNPSLNDLAESELGDPLLRSG